jgi:Na+/H+ antiporter NhaC
MQGVLDRVLGFAKTRRSAQLSISGLGLFIFFDDYANTMVVGNTARTLVDKLGLSREKLAYIVDSTAAPVATLAVLTTWIGYQVSLIDDAIAGIDGFPAVSGYSLFLNSIVYSFYPILAIAFVLMVASTRRDFGPMLRAEQRAALGKPTTSSVIAADEDLTRKDGATPWAPAAVIPILSMVVALIAGLFVTGEGNSIADVIGSADAYTAMLWASMIGVVVASAITLIRRELTLDETVDAWYRGMRSIMLGIVVLVLAWALSSVTSELGASSYLIGLLGEDMSPVWLPAAVFILSAFTVFATGTSWGTMAVMVPLVVPLCWAMLAGQQVIADYHLLYSTIACVLAGSVWGDHCSPIADTTVLSSVASGCNHIEHVRTQLPYALLVGVVALLVGTIPSAFGIPPLVCIVVALVILFVSLRLMGTQTFVERQGAAGHG